MELENLSIEYKREYIDEIKKTVIAFANTVGGKIFIGVNDDLSVIGVDNPDEVMLKATNMIRDSIKPDVIMFMNCTTELMQDKNVVVLEVQKGTAPPYYIASKGVRPEGVFIRQGASSVPATETAILRMIKETSGDNYEKERSLNQNLTFDACKKEFEIANLKLEKEQMRTLDIIGADGLYSNLGLLLSDQCVHTIKAAIFQGNTKETFKDRYEFTGSLFKQLHECFAFIDRYNSTRSEINGLLRKDFRAYPEVAIREALLNAVVHRDYSFSSSTLISIFDNRIEIVTVGGLLRGISLEDMELGVSILRNKNLANIFYRLKLIEAYGTGVIKILESYNNSLMKPLIEATDNAFKITLYNNNEFTEKFHNTSEIRLSKNEKLICDIFKNKEEFKRKDIENSLEISQSMATKYLKVLLDNHIIIKKGNGKNITYSFVD